MKKTLHSKFRREIVLNYSIVEDSSSLGTKQPSAIIQLARIEPSVHIFIRIFHRLWRSLGHFLYT